MTVLEILKYPNAHYKNTTVYHYFANSHPRTLSDFYQFDDDFFNAFPAGSIFLPWIHCKPVLKYSDESFWGRKDDRYVESLVNKLKLLSGSILENGYRPEKYTNRQNGHVTGYFLQLDGEERFYIVSGNHRVAVLSAINSDQTIPILLLRCSHLKPRDKENNELYKQHCTWRRFLFQNHGSYPTVFRGEDVGAWPSVKNGFLTKSQALCVLGRYFGL